MKNVKQWLAGFALGLAGKPMPLAVTEQLLGWLAGRTMIWRKRKTQTVTDTGARLGMARLGQIRLGGNT